MEREQVNARIIDIRQHDNKADLRSQVVNGLLSSPSELPELLLWDTQGQKLFDAFSQTPDYYLYSKEIDILTRYADDIASRVPSKCAVVELGCG